MSLWKINVMFEIQKRNSKRMQNRIGYTNNSNGNTHILMLVVSWIFGIEFKKPIIHWLKLSLYFENIANWLIMLHTISKAI